MEAYRRRPYSNNAVGFTKGSDLLKISQGVFEFLGGGVENRTLRRRNEIVLEIRRHFERCQNTGVAFFESWLPLKRVDVLTEAGFHSRKINGVYFSASAGPDFFVFYGIELPRTFFKYRTLSTQSLRIHNILF